MRLSPEQVDHLALLARLALGDEERAALLLRLNQIVAAVEKIGELALEGVEPTTLTAPLSSAFREDEPSSSLPREEALAAAPARTAEGFLVPRVVGEGA